MQLQQVIGNQHAWQRILRLNNAGRMPPAVILDGPAGIGRRTAARAIAQAILCQQPVNGDACDQCHSCRLMQQGNHSDCVEVDPQREAQELSVEAIREQVVERVFQSPLHGNGQVFIIPMPSV